MSQKHIMLALTALLFLGLTLTVNAGVSLAVNVQVPSQVPVVKPAANTQCTSSLQRLVLSTSATNLAQTQYASDDDRKVSMGGNGVIFFVVYQAGVPGQYQDITKFMQSTDSNIVISIIFADDVQNPTKQFSCTKNDQGYLPIVGACTLASWDQIPASGLYEVYIEIKNKVSGVCERSYCDYSTSPGVPNPCRILVEKKTILRYVISPAMNPGDTLGINSFSRVPDTSHIQIILNSTRDATTTTCFPTYNQALNANDYQYYQVAIPPELSAGYYNIGESINNNTDNLIGNSYNLNYVTQYSLTTNTTYHITINPRIDGLSASNGSISGNKFFIFGAGFSGVPEENVVDYDGLPCTVLGASTTVILCQLGEDSRGPIQNNTLVPGHAGLLLEYYEPADNLSVDNLLTSNVTPTFTTGRLSLEYFLTRDNYAERFTGFFRPKVSGLHRFYVSGDDGAMFCMSLNSSVTNLNNLTCIARTTTYNSFRYFLINNEQGQTRVSSWVNLNAGENYLIRATHRQGVGGGHITVGVEVPSDTLTDNSLPSILNVSISSNYTPQVEFIQFYNVNTSAPGYWALNYYSTSASASSTATSNNLTWNATAAQVDSELSTISGNSGIDIVRIALNKFGNKIISSKVVLDQNGAQISQPTADQLAEAGSRYEITWTNPKPDNSWQVGVNIGDFSRGSSTLKLNGKSSVISSVVVGLSGAQVITNGTKPLSGHWIFQHHGLNTTQLSIDAAAIDVQNALEALYDPLPNIPDYAIKMPVFVERSGFTGVGATWTIMFDGNPGQTVDIQALFVEDITGGAVGQKPTITTTLVRAGSKNQFLAPIPWDMLFTAQTQRQITVTTNGIRANCPNFNCDYSINAPKDTPSVTYSSMDMNTCLYNVALQFPVAQWTPTSQDGYSISIQKIACPITSFQNLASGVVNITCAIPKTSTGRCDLPAGDAKPSINVPTYGTPTNISVSSNITCVLEIDNVTPSRSPTPGGISTIITGLGFGTIATDYYPTVSIGNKSCTVYEFNNTAIYCLIHNNTAGNYTVTVKQNGKVANWTYFEYFVVPNSPRITGPVMLNRSPVLTSSLYIQITGFVDFNIDNYTAYLQAKTTYDNITDAPTVPCWIQSISTSLLYCKIAGGYRGEYTFVLQHVTNGFIFNVQEVTVYLRIIVNSISISEGSVLGGSYIQLTGLNFSDVTNENQVHIGYDLDNTLCDVSFSNNTYLECWTRAASPTMPVDQPIPLEVWGRLSQEAIYMDDAENHTFTYKQEYAFNITSIQDQTLSDENDYMVVVNVTEGDMVIIEGSGFSAGVPLVSFDSNLCTVTNYTDTQITCQAPYLPTSISLPVYIAIFNQGYANTVGFYIQSLLTLDSFTPSRLCGKGGRLTIQGSGFSADTVVMVGTSVCSVDMTLSSTTTLVCSAHLNESSLIDTQLTLTQNNQTVSEPILVDPSTIPQFNVSDNGGTGVLFNNSGSPFFRYTVLVQKLDNFGSNKTVSSVRAVSKYYPDLYFEGAIQSTQGQSTLTAVFDGVSHGDYSFEILVDECFAQQTDNVIMQVRINESLVLNNQSIRTSYGGDRVYTVSMPGFLPAEHSDKVSLQICNTNAEIVSTEYNTLTFRVPALYTANVSDEAPTLELSTMNETIVISDSAATAAYINDGAVYSAYTSTAANCYVGYDFGTNYVANLEEIRILPNPKATPGTAYIQFSNDSVTWTSGEPKATKGSGISQAFTSGYNVIKFTANQKIARYVRYYVQKGGCNVGEFVAIGKRIYTGSEICYKAQYQINGINETYSVPSITYSLNDTPVVTSISPPRGTTAGGTVVTIIGTNFGSAPGDVSVNFDGIACTVTAVNNTQVICTTGAKPSPSASSFELVISPSDSYSKGRAIYNGSDYLYLDLFSSRNTWDGLGVPGAEDIAYVTTGQNILYDLPNAQLKALVIEGNLMFDDSDTTGDIYLETEYIFIQNQGKLQIGTQDQPFTRKVIINLIGNRKGTQIPIYGNKFIALREGALEIHGIERNCWTLLTETAEPGATSIKVRGPIDWNSGEQIVLASSSYNASESEILTVASAPQNYGTYYLVQLTTPLQYEHLSVSLSSDSITLQDDDAYRTEVGLLSRNIVIQGDDTSDSTLWGAQISAESSGKFNTYVQLSNVEIRRAGQAYQKSRFPVNLAIGDSFNSYVTGCSIWNTYNRGINLKGGKYISLTCNTLYNIMGHGIHFDDGSETHNTVQNNLVVLVKPSYSFETTDYTPAGFLIRHPLNTIQHNRVSGGQYGFWFLFNSTSRGTTGGSDTCPSGSSTLSLDSNIAHSCVRHGFMFYPAWTPVKASCTSVSKQYNAGVANTVSGLIAWKNNDTGILAESIGAVKFADGSVIDNKIAGIALRTLGLCPETLTGIVRFMIIGRTNYTVFEDVNATVGLRTPQTEGLLVTDTQFINYATTQTAVSNCWPECSYSRARTSRFSNSRFINTEVRVRWILPFTDIIEDMTGELIGSTGSGWAVYNWPHLNIPGVCQPEVLANSSALRKVDGLICASTTQIRRIAFYNTQPINDFLGMEMKVLRMDAGVNVSTAAISNFSVLDFIDAADLRRSWAIPFATGYQYNIHWRYGLDFDLFRIQPSTLWNKTDSNVILHYNTTANRETFDILLGGVNTTTTETTIAVNTPQLMYGNWSHNNLTREFWLAVNGQRTGVCEIRAIVCRQWCSVAAKPDAQRERLWSVQADWDDFVYPKPQDLDDEVTIPAGYNFTLDEDVTVGYLEVNGNIKVLATKNIILTVEKLWIRDGSFVADYSNSNFTFTIKIKGGQQDSTLVMGQYLDGGNKVLAVTGNLTLLGNKLPISRGLLLQSASQGDTVIQIERASEWLLAGDRIVITSTSFNGTESEDHIVQSVSGESVTLNTSMSYSHIGHISSTLDRNNQDQNVSARVAKLNRNVFIYGSQDHGTYEDTWGCRVLVAQNFDFDGTAHNGQVVFDSVELFNCGQYDTDHAAIHFYKTDGRNSTVTNSVIRGSNGWNVHVNASAAVTLDNNVFYQSVKHGVMVYTLGNKANITITNNWVIDNRIRAFIGVEVIDVVAAIIVEKGEKDAVGVFSTPVIIQNNFICGAQQHGLIAFGDSCGTEYVKNNSVTAALYGILLRSCATNANCMAIKGFSAWRCKVGIVTYATTLAINASELFVAENYNGVSLTAAGINDTSEFAVLISNSTFYGQLTSATAFSTVTYRSILIPVAIEYALPWPPFPIQFNWTKLQSSALSGASFKLENSYFQDFPQNTNGSYGSWALTNNPTALDTQAITYMTNITVKNVAQKSFMQFYDTMNGTDNINACGDFGCSGGNNILVKILDNSLFGNGPGSYIPQVKNVSDVDSTCNNTDISGRVVFCKSLMYGIVAFESKDDDRRSRIFSPIQILNDKVGFRSVLNSFADHTYTKFYTGLNRLSRFGALVQLNLSYNVSFAGTHPDKLQYKLYGTQSATDYVVLKTQYETPQTITVVKTTDGYPITANILKEGVATDLSAKPAQCGSSDYFFDTRELEFLLNGQSDCGITVKVMETVFVTVRFRVSVEEFFNSNGPATFIDKFAAMLGVNPWHVRVTNIITGSAVVYADYSAEPGQYAEADEAYNKLNGILSNDYAAFDDVGFETMNASLVKATKRDLIGTNGELPESKQFTFTKHKSKTGLITGVSVAGAVAVIMVCVVFILCMRKKKFRKMASRAVSPIGLGTQGQPKMPAHLDTESFKVFYTEDVEGGTKLPTRIVLKSSTTLNDYDFGMRSQVEHTRNEEKSSIMEENDHELSAMKHKDEEFEVPAPDAALFNYRTDEEKESFSMSGSHLYSSVGMESSRGTPSSRSQLSSRPLRGKAPSAKKNDDNGDLQLEDLEDKQKPRSPKSGKKI